MVRTLFYSIIKLMNHIREGASTGTSTAICRLSTVKSVVQIRCRPCQEILSWYILLSIFSLISKSTKNKKIYGLFDKIIMKRKESVLGFNNLGFLKMSSWSISLKKYLHTRVAQLSVSTISAHALSPLSSQILFECRQCSFETTEKNNAIEHMQCHRNMIDCKKEDMDLCHLDSVAKIMASTKQQMVGPIIRVFGEESEES
ncbi:unnamed protein product [Dracunculus medinensis]|uniref:C2H2-type domain-containing protein n=1 Tax=Dracunculus medinensis TaxID=318479 RepID=A0A0N4U8I3_DRAME|nr:unnamed protein product [Dracunculus medinensis]